MMDDLQQAYSAYQNALVNLRNPKVSNALTSPSESPSATLVTDSLKGPAPMVWHWYTVRSLRLAGACRRGILAGDADGPELRQGTRNILPPRYNIQAAAEI